jgi:alginate O-acetyltransferase complex protein AlgI
MLFSSIPFIVCFLPLVLLAYYYCPFIQARNTLLLFASLIFYGWGEPNNVLVMLFSILINYRIGVFLGDTALSNSVRRGVLAAGVLANVLLLFYFKYFVFSEWVINEIFRMIHYPQFQLPILNIVLPLGISFYTFQSLSYLVDVYKKPSLVQKNILYLGLYISFFPQLIAGPIVRYNDINEQIKERVSSVSVFCAGIERFIIGLAKKVLIDNGMAAMADRILDLPPSLVSCYFLALGIICYALQIYYDFSGYSDMAIGLGKMFGFTIRENFNYPYSSKTIKEFWTRWHISLSAWFKDYLYIPLGGNRKGKARTVLNLFIVFFITGLWHGAAVNFVFWGLGHGLLLFNEKLFGRRIGAAIKNNLLKNMLGHLYTLFSVFLLWVFFRLGMRRSLRFVRELLTFNQGVRAISSLIQSEMTVPFIFCFIAAVVFAFPWQRRFNMTTLADLNLPRLGVLVALLILSICALASNSYNPFIYFRF